MCISLIVPLAYYGDYRPYFTIHDTEVKEFITKTLVPPPIILGVTNPYFSKTLDHWPHIVRVTDTTKKGKYIFLQPYNRITFIENELFINFENHF